MQEATNKPYVKKYDSNGVVINPINGLFRNDGSNRANRKPEKERFMNNSKSEKLVITKMTKHRKRVQWIGDKQIIHYDLRMN